MGAAYRRLSFRVGADDEDELAAVLWEHGTLGLEVSSEVDEQRRVIAWFGAEESSWSEAAWGRFTGSLVAEERVEKRDWLAAYRRSATPFPLGGRLLVDPGEPNGDVAAAPGRELLQLPARTAFGTGSHPSTWLLVELLEECELSGRRVLDVGTGTGILSFAAALFGAASVVALDVDPGAALQAGRNRRLNPAGEGMAVPRFLAGGVGSLSSTSRFDLLLVNVLPRSIESDLVGLRDLIAPGGTAIFSGILESGAAAVVQRLEDLGLTLRRRHSNGEWVALRWQAV